MGFHDVRFPADIAYGYESGPGFNTEAQPTASGHEFRIGRWSQARHRYQAAQELLSESQRAAIKDFYLARRGGLHSFRWKDWSDYTTAADGTSAPSALDQTIGSGDGSAVNFQLRKQYDLSGPNPYVRLLRLPVAGTVLVAIDGTPTVSFTTNLQTGVITLNSAPTYGAVVTAGCQFDVPVAFDRTVDELLRQRLTAFQVSQILSIDIVEALDETESPELWEPGGSTVNMAFNSGMTLSPTSGRFVHLKSLGTGVPAFLPPPGDELPGGEYWLVHNDAAASGTVSVRDDAGNLVVTLAAGESARIFLSRNDAAGTTQWVAI